MMLKDKERTSDLISSDRVEGTAVFGEVGFEVTDDFNITVGGRFFDIESERTLKQGALFPLGTEPDCDVDFCFADAVGSSSEQDFVPKLTLDYHLTDDTMVYATYSEGFRRGGANPAMDVRAAGHSREALTGQIEQHWAFDPREV